MPPSPSDEGGSSGFERIAHHTITISAISGIFRASMIHRNPQVTVAILPRRALKSTLSEGHLVGD
jgi:hypothetical protein